MGDRARAGATRTATERRWQWGGRILVAGSLLQLVAAALPNFRVFTSSDPAVQIDAIRRGRSRWNAQAVGFPVAFAVVAAGVAMTASAIAGRPARTCARLAAGSSAASACLWLPIAVRRLRLASAIDTRHAERRARPIDIGGPTFWPYTYATLASLFLMGCALALTGGLRRFGLSVAAASVSAVAVSRRWHDWPPLLSYFVTLALGIRIARAHPR